MMALSCSVSYSQKIKTITEFKTREDTVITIRKSTFDKRGKLLEEVYYGGYDQYSESYRNKHKIVSYKGGKKVSELNCGSPGRSLLSGNDSDHHIFW